MIKYPDRSTLMKELAGQVADQLRAAIEKNGRATLSVPGGSTPSPFLQALSQAELNWSKVAVFLNDERFVDEASERSNTRLLKENLLINQASHARLIAMTAPASNPEDVIDMLASEINRHLPIDVLVVGMGEDMHTASLFPDSPDLAHALSDHAPILAIIRADNAKEPRITLTAPLLRAAHHKHLLIAGKNKIAPLEKAMASTSEIQAPIRTVIAGQRPATIHYAD